MFPEKFKHQVHATKKTRDANGLLDPQISPSAPICPSSPASDLHYQALHKNILFIKLLTRGIFKRNSA